MQEKARVKAIKGEAITRIVNCQASTLLQKYALSRAQSAKSESQIDYYKKISHCTKNKGKKKKNFFFTCLIHLFCVFFFV